MQEAVPEGKGLMAAVLGLERDRVNRICGSLKSGYASPANYNCPGQIVIAGEKSAVEEAIELCKQAGAKRAVPLSVGVPSHCKLMSDASKRLAELFEGIEFKEPVIPLVNNADAGFLNNIGRYKIFSHTSATQPSVVGRLHKGHCQSRYRNLCRGRSGKGFIRSD